MMDKLEYKLSFITPAFLGNAEQQAQWRAPPFKSLLRHWWRIVESRRVDFDATRLRREEAALFGSASDDGGAKSGKSRVRIRLESWELGTMTDWPQCERVHHPEVGDGGRDVGADLYLGFGPLAFQGGRGTTLGTIRGTTTMRTAVNPQERSVVLRIACPTEASAGIKRAVQLAAWFGSVGSRSRNGWGSLAISGEGLDALNPHSLGNFIRPVSQCLTLEWPHSIGSDDRGALVWTLKPRETWREVVHSLARLKISMRTRPSVLSLDGKRDGDVSARHVLAYPLTNHAALGPVNRATNSAGWVDFDSKVGNPRRDKKGKFIQGERLANQIRFKVGRQNDKYVGIVFHVPHKVPDRLLEKLDQRDQKFIRNNEKRIWQQVHMVLDNAESGAARLQGE